MPLPHKTNAVIRFHADGFDIDQSWLMGRQMAGHGFLRAAVKARGRGPLFGYMAYRLSRRRRSPLWCEKLIRLLSLCG